MPFIETVDELVESIADYAGRYGSNNCGCEYVDEDGDHLGDHKDDCNCRMCFVSEMRSRIMKAVAYDLGVSNLST